MFTGLIQELGRIEQILEKKNNMQIGIFSPLSFPFIQIGDSVAVNGCCLTVTKKEGSIWYSEAVSETLKRTSLEELQKDDLVNLELPVRLQDRLGGHLVQGHVDGVGKILEKSATDNEFRSWKVEIQLPKSLIRYIVEKGSIAVDGVSLTVCEVKDESFTIALIPHTAKHTTLGIKKTGTSVNVEVDMMAKYLEKLVKPYERN